MQALYAFKKARPVLYNEIEAPCELRSLRSDSPERYSVPNGAPPPPFSFDFVEVGPRLGWRWTNEKQGGCCEIQWLDPEPYEGGFDDCTVYLKRYSEIRQEDVNSFRGFLQPPTREQYLARRNSDRHDSSVV
ncbi:expressed unknown protein [Seminavis robusta]|uniref:Uncharacterized protein n=1 Tax=Seminavis robusta TaxID=568900 RepID=A0A9N8HY74_9STRA|nr:expressed unknown protein [Seminavis robusta]|eukprot:Sro2405_g326480.1 n/a (132) ;mRNA; r:5836-6231